MKKTLTLFIFLLSLSLYSQRTTQPILLDLDGDIFIGDNDWSQNNPQPLPTETLVRYKDNIYSPFQITTQTDGYYGTNPMSVYNWSINTPYQESLTLDYYTSIYTVPNRPAVFLLYGGGFANGDKEDMKIPAYLFAMKGYAVFAINYRLLGTANHAENGSLNLNVLCNGGNFNDIAWYWAMQDLNAAIKAVAFHKTAYEVDPNKIFLYGSSAGAITALQLAYTTEQEVFDTFPGVNFNSHIILGNLDHTTYPPARSQTYNILGVGAIAGALMRDDYLDSNETTAAIMLHNPCDDLVSYNIDNDGLTSSGFGSCNGTWYGSRYIYDQMGNWGSAPAHNLYAECGLGIGNNHGLNHHSELELFTDKKVPEFFYNILNSNVIQPNINVIDKDTFCNDTDGFWCDNTQNKMSNNTVKETDNLLEVNFMALVEEMESTLINNNLKAYPNPTKGKATINIGLWEEKEVTVNVYGTIGNLISSNLINVKDSNQSYTINLFNEAKGLYFVQVASGSRTYMLKIIKQ